MEESSVSGEDCWTAVAEEVDGADNLSKTDGIDTIVGNAPGFKEAAMLSDSETKIKSTIRPTYNHYKKIKIHYYIKYSVLS